jgi:hypothetical protein
MQTDLHTVIALFTIVTAVGIIGAGVMVLLTTADSAAAWHSQYESKKQCLNYYTSVGNTTKEANVICNEITHK